MHYAALPLMLRVAVLVDIKVAQLKPTNTGSYAYRRPRVAGAAGMSDHCGWAADFGYPPHQWGDRCWPSHMTPQQAAAMSAILERFRTPDGRHVFGWGAIPQSPGMVYTGPHYSQTRYSDPQHVFVAPGISVTDLKATANAMGIQTDGMVRPVSVG